MEITVSYPLAKVALGYPALVTFAVTPRSLAAFNRSQGGTIKNAPSFNEAVNRERGLPDANARQWLRALYCEKFGIMGGALKMSDVKNAVN
jgi:hypothetical protein